MKNFSLSAIHFSCMLLLVTNALFSSVVVADTRRHRRDEVTGHVPSTHEEILSHRERRKELFGDKLQEMQQKMSDHASGAVLMTKSEHDKVERKIKAYQGKLEELNRVFDERHSSRLMAREELLNDMTRARMASSREEL